MIGIDVEIDRESEGEIEREREREREIEGVIFYFLLLFFRNSAISPRSFKKRNSLPCFLTFGRQTIRVF